MRFGKALNFDGSNERVYIGDPSSGVLDFDTGSFTYSLWVYSTGSVGSSDMPWHKYGGCPTCTGYDMGLGTGDWSASISDGTRTMAHSFGSETLNQWVYLAAVVDRSSQRAYTYFNGVRVNNNDISWLGSVSNALPATIGSNHVGDYPFKGIIDEVAIYKKALSQDEINQLYSGLLSPGQLATIKPLTPLSKGTHTLRLCTANMCNTAILTII